MKCEQCNIDHEGSFGSGRFCSKKCARSFSTSLKRKEINQKVSEKLKGKISPFKGLPGKSHTEESKKKIAESIQRYWSGKDRLSIEYHKARNVANVLKYRAKKRLAIPPDADLNLIKRIYECCPKGYEVDHIIALSVGGKHHQDNLQYLPSLENKKKGNRDVYDKNQSLDWRSFISIRSDQQ